MFSFTHVQIDYIKHCKIVGILFDNLCKCVKKKDKKIDTVLGRVNDAGGQKGIQRISARNDKSPSSAKLVPSTVKNVWLN